MKTGKLRRIESVESIYAIFVALRSGDITCLSVRILSQALTSRRFYLGGYNE